MNDIKKSDEQRQAAGNGDPEAAEAHEAEQPTDEAQPMEPEQPAEVEPSAEQGSREQELQAELDETRDRLLRALAEVENLRRRKEREVEEAHKYAVTGFARELLDVADNLSRALESIPDEARAESEVVKSLAEGVAMTEKTLLGSFERHRISKITPELGEKFDHNLHQAMLEVATDQQPPGTVAQVMQPGYLIADRLLRPAMVGVAKAPPAAEQEAPDDDERVVRIRRGE